MERAQPSDGLHVCLLTPRRAETLTRARHTSARSSSPGIVSTTTCLTRLVSGTQTPGQARRAYAQKEG